MSTACAGSSTTRPASIPGGGLEEFLEREVERYRPQLQRYALLARQARARARTGRSVFSAHAGLARVGSRGIDRQGGSV